MSIFEDNSTKMAPYEERGPHHSYQLRWCTCWNGDQIEQTSRAYKSSMWAWTISILVKQASCLWWLCIHSNDQQNTDFPIIDIAFPAILLLGWFYFVKGIVSFNRKPISASVFGTNALITKPALSVSPMIVVNILNRYHYDSIKRGNATSSPQDLDQLHSAMFSLLCLIPVVLGSIQIIIWSWYPFKHSGDNSQKKINSLEP